MASIKLVLAWILSLAATWAVALPHPLAPRADYNSSASTSTAVVWYQGQPDLADSSCGYAVSSGEIKAGQCYTLHTESFGVKQQLDHACVLKMWDGVVDCAGNGTWTEYAIPKGNATTCIEAGVEDGGEMTHKSAQYWCL